MLDFIFPAALFLAVGLLSWFRSPDPNKRHHLGGGDGDSGFSGWDDSGWGDGDCGGDGGCDGGD